MCLNSTFISCNINTCTHHIISLYLINTVWYPPVFLFEKPTFDWLLTVDLPQLPKQPRREAMAGKRFKPVEYRLFFVLGDGTHLFSPDKSIKCRKEHWDSLTLTAPT